MTGEQIDGITDYIKQVNKERKELAWKAWRESAFRYYPKHTNFDEDEKLEEFESWFDSLNAVDND